MSKLTQDLQKQSHEMIPEFCRGEKRVGRDKTPPGVSNPGQALKRLGEECKLGLAHSVARGGSCVPKTGGMEEGVPHVEENLLPQQQTAAACFAGGDIKRNQDVEVWRVVKGDDIGDGIVIQKIAVGAADCFVIDQQKGDFIPPPEI